MSSSVTVEPLLRCHQVSGLRKATKLCCSSSSAVNCSRRRQFFRGAKCELIPKANVVIRDATRAFASGTAVAETSESSVDVFFRQRFPVTRTEAVEGKMFVRLDQENGEGNWQLTVGCSIPGNWILHWGVSYVDDLGSEWDQPPEHMRPSGSVPVKDYAIETPLKKSSEDDPFYEVKIDIDPNSAIAAVNFVLKDEETGTWYQYKGSDFKLVLVDNHLGGGNGTSSINLSGPFLTNSLLKSESSDSMTEPNGDKGEDRKLEGIYEELPITKHIAIDNSVTVSVRKCPETSKNLLHLETDLPAAVVHWGVCRDDTKDWEIPPGPHPPGTIIFKEKALRTSLQSKEDGRGCSGLFTLDEGLAGFLFVLKLNDSTWLKCMGNDFYIPLSSSSSLLAQPGQEQSKDPPASERGVGANQGSGTAFTDEIIKEIRHLVSGISAESSQKVKTKEAQESILQEIEKLAAEAYSIFRSSTPTFKEEVELEEELKKAPPLKFSGTGSGYEILLQGFNWESHKSGRWYTEFKDKAEDIASLGFTVVWLPPPTDSVSPEGYMPRDLYNLNSRYGNVDELKDLVGRLHKSGLKVLGDAVLNHRCAQYQNQNGIWNMFGGRLNWDDRAVVADDPHFQGRGNKSSGDNFHAAPNIDHSQDFVRKDLKEWMCWLREEIGYDGWRLDFVRGFWGGYVKDYMDATNPDFAVGEYWDSLSYTYGEMDHNQDAHRQRIIDWINATSGTAGAFDVTTKGILHAALERCEYWRLSDSKGKPPGVVGWWPSRAVTFVENHDTGSTQGHWRFPGGKEMQGYAYILTHPGTPAVFFDHVFYSDYRSEITALLAFRNRHKLHCRSIVKIAKAERDVYAAIIDDKVAVKIGPGHFEPSDGNWSSALEGRDYKLWEVFEFPRFFSSTMAMQAAFSSKILLIAGAGYAGTVLVQKGKLSDLIGELQVSFELFSLAVYGLFSQLNFRLSAIVKGIEKGETDGGESHADAIAQQVRRLAQEVRQLASARQITVLNANGQSGSFTSLIIPGAALGAVGYGYMWWKGLKFSDLMYVTKKNMTAAVSNLTKSLEGVSDALAKAKEHLTQRIQGLDDKMDTQKEISKAIQNDVSDFSSSSFHSLVTTIHENIQLLDSDLWDLKRIVSGLVGFASLLCLWLSHVLLFTFVLQDGKIDSLDNKQDLTNMGIAYLCNFANGKKVTMPKVLEDQLSVPGRTRNSLTFHQGSDGMGLKSLTYSLARSASVPVNDIIQQNGEEPQMPSINQVPLLRLSSAKC
ncbi:Alpha-amylase 3, chloroplastic [Linum perenne]